MLKIAQKYTEYFRAYKSQNIIQKSFFVFMLVLPHIIASLILILIYPQQWLGIIILGILLPDFFYFTHGVMHNIFKKQFTHKTEKNMRVTIHLLLIIILIILLIKKEYVLFLAGGIHLIIDAIGF